MDSKLFGILLALERALLNLLDFSVVAAVSICWGLISIRVLAVVVLSLHRSMLFGMNGSSAESHAFSSSCGHGRGRGRARGNNLDGTPLGDPLLRRRLVILAQKRPIGMMVLSIGERRKRTTSSNAAADVADIKARRMGDACRGSRALVRVLGRSYISTRSEIVVGQRGA